MARSPKSRKTTTARSLGRAEPEDDTAHPAEESPAVEDVQSDNAAHVPQASAELRKKDLVNRVIAASGMKKRDVKPIVEATLAVLGGALSNEEVMNLQPFGKLMVNRKKERSNGEVLVTRIRRSTQAINPSKDPLAGVAE